jgi:predicted house-cleaning noncanonical NTP pyrophosphatase (MazG superfamily)
MARLLIAADLQSVLQRAAAQRLLERMKSDGHDVALATDAPVTACAEADGVVAILDGAHAALAVAFAAVAHAQSKPVLALHSQPIPDALTSLFTQTHATQKEADFQDALAPFYAQVRPHAGKLVRDMVPRLVREAGHQVQFREAAPEERPRYLKRKVSDEAAELLAADPGQEREEVADLLEALEALIRERGYDRNDLKLVKDAKRKRRGAFERCLVVESASAITQPSEQMPDMPAWPDEETSQNRAQPVAEEADAEELSFEIPEIVEPEEPAPTKAASYAPLFPPSTQTTTPRQPPVEGPQLWNLGFGDKREPIAPKVDDPEHIDAKLREI